MTLTKYLFDGVDGTDMTTANSGASVVSLNGGTAKFSAATKQSGSTGGRWVSTSTGACLSRFMAAAPNARMAFEGVITLPANLPSTGNSSVFMLRHTAGNILQVQLSTTGTCVVFIFGSGDTKHVTTDGSESSSKRTPVTPGSKYRISIVASGASTTAGSFTVKIYTPTGNTPLGFLSLVNQNMSANMIAGIDVYASSDEAGTAVGWDDLQLSDGATSEIGPYTEGNSIPIANAGPDQTVQSYEIVTLTGSGTDADGSIASGAWTQTVGAAVTLGGSGLTRSFTAAASVVGETLTFSLVVTDNLGAASIADTMTVTILPHLEWLKVSAALVPIRRSD